MTRPRRISLCLAAIALTALSACSQASTDESALVFDATSSAKFQKSLVRIETGLSDDEQVALMQAMNALEVYPLDGNCDVNNILAHTQQFADPAFRQKVRLRRLHGLTAEQIIDQAKEKNCNQTVGLSETVSETVPKVTPQLAKQKAIVSLDKIVPVLLRAEPYMTSELIPRYATLTFSCNGFDGVLEPLLLDSLKSIDYSENGSLYYSMADVRGFGPYAMRNMTKTTYFDGEPFNMSPKYKTIEKQVSTGDGKFVRYRPHI